MLRKLRITFEWVGAFIGAGIVVGIILIWHLSTQPVQSTFLTPTFVSAIDRLLPGTHSTIDHTILAWNNTDFSLALHADNIQINDAAGSTVAVVPSVDVEVNLLGIVFGHFLPSSLMVEHPQIHLAHDLAGGWSWAGDKGTHNQADIRSVLQAVIDNLAEAHLTRKLEIHRALVDVIDTKAGTSWTVSVPDITLIREGEVLTGQTHIDITQATGVSTIQLDYHYDLIRRRHDASIGFNNLIPAQFAGGHPALIGLPQASMANIPLSGSASVVFDNYLAVQNLALQVHGSAGYLEIPVAWGMPRHVDAIEASAMFDVSAEHPLQASASLNFGGPVLSASVDAVLAEPSGVGLKYNLNLNLDNLSMDQFDQVWPKLAIPDARDWIVSGIVKGQMTHAEAGLTGHFSWSDLENMTIDAGKGKIAVTGARVNYLEGMPPVDGVDAHADFDLHQMIVQISSGGIGDLRMKPFTITMSDLDKDTQLIDIPLRLLGPGIDVLQLLNQPRLGYLKALGMTTADITGQVDALVDLQFPLLKSLDMKDVTINAHGDLSNVASSQLVKSIDITQGNMALDLTKTGFTIKGHALLDRVPSEVDWQYFFDPSSGQPLAEGRVTGLIGSDQLRGLGVESLRTTRGSVVATLQIKQTSKTKTFIDAMIDAGATDLYFAPLNWHKPAGAAAVLKFSAAIDGNKPITLSNINLRGLKIAAKGEAVISGDGNHLVSLDLPSLILGRTNAAIHYGEEDDDDHTLDISIAGKSLDIGNLTGGKEPTHADIRPQRFTVKLDTLYTSDTGFLSSVDGYALHDQIGWDEIRMHGRAMGDQWLDIALVSKVDHRVFLATCDDFGEALNGLGFTSAVRLGKLKISGVSTVENPRIIEGTVKIDSFVVSDLPLLATLVNAMSPFGFVDLMNKTMSFDHLKGKFRWRGDDIDLMQVNLPASAVGMNIEGRVNMNSGDANLTGTIVPFSMVNQVLNNIPLIGDLITGGEGQGVLAVSYSIKGRLGHPSIGVNPISLITPGFVRNLFFGADDSDDSLPEQDPIPNKALE